MGDGVGVGAVAAAASYRAACRPMGWWAGWDTGTGTCVCGVWREGGRQCMCWQRLGLVASPPSLGWQRMGGALKTLERKLSIADSGRRDSVLGRHCCVGRRKLAAWRAGKRPTARGGAGVSLSNRYAGAPGRAFGLLMGQQCGARSGGERATWGRGPERRKAGLSAGRSRRD